jgi:regulator of protease activity HflC (stomatin/prohibitin superfamily)
MLILEQKWGKDTGLMEPGPRCCYGRHRQVKVCISRNSIRYNCPISDVVTKDNVHVSLDMGVNFHIGREESTFEEDARRFFYNFGPNRLDELLSEEMDEAIRDFIRKCKVKDVRNIKTELTQEILENLYAKFLSYGVVIDQINCMNIILPSDLSSY